MRLLDARDAVNVTGVITSKSTSAPDSLVFDHTHGRNNADATRAPSIYTPRLAGNPLCTSVLEAFLAARSEVRAATSRATAVRVEWEACAALQHLISVLDGETKTLIHSDSISMVARQFVSSVLSVHLDRPDESSTCSSKTKLVFQACDQARQALQLMGIKVEDSMPHPKEKEKASKLVDSQSS